MLTDRTNSMLTDRTNGAVARNTKRDARDIKRDAQQSARERAPFDVLDCSGDADATKQELIENRALLHRVFTLPSQPQVRI